MLAYIAALVLSYSGSVTPQASQDSSTQWGPASISPMVLAQRCDQRIHGIKHAVVAYGYNFRLDMGKASMGGMAAIKDDHTFRVEAPVAGVEERHGYRWDTRVAAGGKIRSYQSVDQKAGVTKPFTSKASLPSKLIDLWLRQNVKFLFLPVGTDAKPLEELVRECTPASGYRASVQQRTLLDRYNGKDIKIKRYRLYIQRTPEMAKKKGQLFYEVVVDSDLYIPITMSNLVKPSRKVSYYTSMYGTRWNLNADTRHPFYPENSFDLKNFHVSTQMLGK